MSDTDARAEWLDDRTTFQRVYDVVIGTHASVTAQEVAERARCSETGARQALDQLVEMGIVHRRDGRPASYRRNESYLRWKRVDSLARGHSASELRQRVDELLEEDAAFQETYGVPDPDAVSIEDVPVSDHDALEERWDQLNEWRTVRRDIRVLRQAVQQAQAGSEDSAQA